MTAPKRHLVLGGSEGIGFAYADYMAARGDHLTIVARRPALLKDARDRLLLHGASTVDVVSGDLLEPDFRALLKSQSGQYNSILVSGPSPPAGGLEILSRPDWETLAINGCRIAFTYPSDFLFWALANGLAPHGRVILITSYVTRTPYPDPRFFLSQTFRLELEALAMSLLPRFEMKHLAVSIWRPSVVLTELAVAYAYRLAGPDVIRSRKEATTMLKQAFAVAEVPLASAYISSEMESLI